MKTTLPARYYVDPQVFDAEIERYYWNTWVAVGRSEELPQRGDYFLRDLAGESLIFTRATGGQVNAFFNVCRHRGTQVCVEPRGSFGERIQCPYHAWTYDLAGRLVAAPHMDSTEGFVKDEYPLEALHAAEWEGFIFVNGAAAPAPLSDQLGDVPGKLEPWGMAGLRRAHAMTYDVKTNWKLVIANYSECLHCPIIHPALNRLSHYLSGRNDPATAGHVGGRMDLRDGFGTMSLDGVLRRPILPGLSKENSRQILYYAMLPNLLINLHPDYMTTFTLWPRACDRTEIVCEWHFHPDAMARPDFDARDAVEFWDLTNRQDWHVCALAQRGISSRSFTPGPYSDREALLWDFDRIIE